jgi:hypothetical protein
MDPITVIVTALSLGAQTALKSTVETATKEAYASLKAIVLRKLTKQPDAASAVEAVEHKPDSAVRREILVKELTIAGAHSDQEVVDKATDLLKLLETKLPGVTGGLVGQINAAGGKVLVLSGGNQGTINM